MIRLAGFCKENSLKRFDSFFIYSNLKIAKKKNRQND